ncbi:hypothetical protein FB451DRAFT_463347 [Mycena latifolia]|nr:hypothetical protein FB451DRAFT_463347 [Mycena latifolia]
MAYIVDPDAFENYWSIVINEVCTAGMGVLLYGVFIVLFLIALHLLYHRRSPGRGAFLALTVVMALLATTQFLLHVATVALSLRLLETAVKDGWAYPPSSLTATERLYWALVLTQDVVLVTNSVVTDGLLIYRCYLVWGRPRKALLVLPVLLILGTLGTGYMTSYDQDSPSDEYHLDPRIVFGLNLVTNFVTMALTAARIWWVTRTQRAVLGSDFTPRYNAAIAIILESGAIYCAGLIFQVVGLSVQGSKLISPPVYLSHGTIGQLVNIVPTLIVVRVGLGHTEPTTAPDAMSVSRVPQPLVFATGGSESETDVPLEDVGRK